MLIIKSVSEMILWRQHCDSSKPVVLIPTMGGLHQGHASLIKEAQCLHHPHQVVVSLFVNPLQFDRLTDLEHYPCSWDQDVEFLKQLKVDVLFAPDHDFTPRHMSINPGALAESFYGHIRPGHLRGVCSIVMKLFIVIRPHTAVFGRKDYQQLQLVKQLIIDFGFDIKIHPVATQRCASGVAISTRNARLSDEALNHKAPLIISSLKAAHQHAIHHQRITSAELIDFINDRFKTHDICPNIVEILHRHTLQKLDHPSPEGMIFVSVCIEGVDLIDHWDLNYSVTTQT